MANVASSYSIVHPSFMEPGVLMPYYQASGAFVTLASEKPMVKLGEGDLYVYVKRFDVRTKVSAGQSAGNLLSSVSTTLSVIQTPTYLARVRGEYDHHDSAAMGRWGLSIVDAQRLGMRQGHFTQMRGALLYGFQPQNGEGLLNAQGATAVSLPADSFGNTTVTTYDNGQMATFIIGQISALKTSTNQLGIARHFVILGPQEVLGQFEYQNVVQLTQYQRPGAGVSSTAGMVKDVLSWNGDTVDWVYDDTLKGKGAGGTDAVIIVMPEVEQPSQPMVNTNEIAKLEPNLAACTLMYCDMAAPREIPTPLPGGAIDVVSEWRYTSGWAVRPEVVTVISMPYP